MKLAGVYEGAVVEDRKFYLRLVQCGDGSIKLVACDSDGVRLHQGDILEIGKTRGIRRYTCVSEDLGFDLDDDRKVVVVD